MLQDNPFLCFNQVPINQEAQLQQRSGAFKLAQLIFALQRGMFVRSFWSYVQTLEMLQKGWLWKVQEGL